LDVPLCRPKTGQKVLTNNLSKKGMKPGTADPQGGMHVKGGAGGGEAKDEKQDVKSDHKGGDLAGSKSAAELQKDLDVAKARIKELEEELAKLKEEKKS